MRRGYTEHEMLDNLTLTHMNGRVHDQTSGRFVSADPFVQAPHYSQSLNRYAYVWNNPLTLIDPSGFAGGRPDPDCPECSLPRNPDYWITNRMVLLPRPHAPPRHTVDEAMDGELSTVGGARRENGNTTTPVWDFFLGTAIGSVNDLLALGHGIGYAEMMPYVEAYHPELVGEIESTPAPQLACPDSNIGQLGCDAAPATVGAVTGVVGGARAVGARIFTRGAARGIAPQIAKIEKQLAQHGRASVEKSLRSLERRLAEHRQALETYRAQGGFTSSVEREIRAFEAEIQAIKEVLGRGP